jgi:hypothetical protein
MFLTIQIKGNPYPQMKIFVYLPQTALDDTDDVAFCSKGSAFKMTLRIWNFALLSLKFTNGPNKQDCLILVNLLA